VGDPVAITDQDFLVCSIMRSDTEEVSNHMEKWYLGNPFNLRFLFGEMRKAWGLQVPMENRPLNGNQFMLEFEFE